MGFPRYLTITGMRCADLASLSRLVLLSLLLIPGSSAWAEGPAAAITAPADGASISGIATLSADAVDQTAQVTGMQFLLDGHPIGPLLTQAPYRFQWDTGVIPNGQHSLAVQLSDSFDDTVLSATESVTVANLLPAITFISPGPYAVGTITVAVQVSDSAAPVSQVEIGSESAQLYFNEAQPVSLAPIQYPYQVQWNTLGLPNNQYEWIVTAIDAAGNKATAAPDSIIVQNFPALKQPTVTITTPRNGEDVSGPVVLTARPNDGGIPIRSVQYRLDGIDLGGLVTKPPYRLSWDSTTVPDGLHAIVAFATNDLGGSGESELAEVYVVNHSPPSVTILAPVDGATVSGDVELNAMVTDAEGSRVRVVYMLNGSPLSRSVTRAPYTFKWNTQKVPNGAITLTAVATDDSRESATSAPVTVTVSNQPCKMQKGATGPCARPCFARGRFCLSGAPMQVKEDPPAPH
jgi:hypothetical protein